MQYKWTVLTVTTVGQLMASLDFSLIIVALPTIIEALNISLFAGIWVITGYRLMLTILMITIGRFADIMGRVRLYNTGFTIFTVGSALCALSTSGELLVASRLIQGLGAALLFVNSMALVADAFPASELGTAIGINQVAINTGQIMGYTLSGVMIALCGWRSIFWINVPVGVFGTIWTHRRLRDLYRAVEKQRFDYPGAILFSTGLTLVLLSLTLGGLRSVTAQLILAAGIVLLAVFLFHEARVDEPVLDMSLFKIRPFTAGNLSNLVNGMAYAGLTFELTLYLQLVKGLSPLQTGIAIIPMQVTFIFVGPISGRLSDKYGVRGLSTVGLALTSVALLMFSTFSIDTSAVTISAALALVGLGIGMFRSPNASSVMGSVPPERRGMGSGVRSTVMNISQSVSIPLTLTLMTAVMPYDKLAVVVSATTLSNSLEVLDLLGAIRYGFFAFAVINGLGVIPSILRGPRTNSPNGKSLGQAHAPHPHSGHE